MRYASSQGRSNAKERMREEEKEEWTECFLDLKISSIYGKQNSKSDKALRNNTTVVTSQVIIYMNMGTTCQPIMVTNGPVRHIHVS